ncbi:hypothetical protein CFH99_04095 [Nocardioides aromaticivorans]|uniref:Methyltransferase type 11 domain-containing protein n=1 Tax=Nocardioides aromaticivorans TaxID=200618 RepID=A0ABX7PFR9_9ACTN|nr:methyltransferase domain-containing protein [Nocardioides aromaticivorans]QSR24799.1 hypothetical protein CFH99_04095 [Nocardioides aromaticivorans]
MYGPPPLAERIRQVEERLHVISALATALEDPISVLQLIVDTGDEAEAMSALQERYGFDAIQASAVTDMQFRRAIGRQRAGVIDERDHLSSQLTDLRQAVAQQQAVAAHYDARAATYDASGMHRDLAALVAEQATDLGDGLVVDVATGTGLVLRAIATRHPEARLVGVDLSPGMLAVARTALPQAQLVQADASALPVAGESVDLMTCVTALHLLAEPELAFDEWARVLRPGGRLVTATFSADTGGPARPDLPQGFARRHEEYRTPEQVRRAFRDHWFELESHTEHELQGDRLLVCVLRRVG